MISGQSPFLNRISSRLLEKAQRHERLALKRAADSAFTALVTRLRDEIEAKRARRKNLPERNGIAA
jgi:hypothetical protein